ncbi:MFS transporter [Jonesiaceae bacterium BS-20]|uniref:MFS transporter n=1 Tax=Jonesiaceae bacterium BS-20 TaxID=3120821 RepID=A0AAU7DZ68_9MICO
MSHPQGEDFERPHQVNPGSRRPELLQIVGLNYFPIAFIGRLPFAMTVVGVLTLIVSVTGSIGDAGLTSATVGLGTAIAGPFIGMAADRYGQRLVLLTCSLIHASALIGLTVLTYQGAPLALLLAGAFLIGASAPQLAAMSRARLLGVINTLVSPVRRSKTLNNTMSIESVADELVFVFGPVAVGLLAVQFGAGAPLGIAAALTLIFVGSFALHPTGRLVRSTAAQSGQKPPLKEFLGAKYLVLIFSMLAIGSFFGAMLTSLTAFMDDVGKPESAGVLYGALGIGSAVLALSMTLMPQRFALPARMVTFAAVMFGAAVFLPSVATETSMTVVLVVLGIGIGPVLVTLFSLASIHAPAGRTATLMTILSSSIVVGQAAFSAITGQVVEVFGTRVALQLPVWAVGALLLAAVVNLLVLKVERPTKA